MCLFIWHLSPFDEGYNLITYLWNREKNEWVVKLRNYLCELYLLESIVKSFLVEGNGGIGSIGQGEYHLDDLIDGL